MKGYLEKYCVTSVIKMKINQKQLTSQLILLFFMILGCQNLDKSDSENLIQATKKEEISNLDTSFISIDSVDFNTYPEMLELRAWVNDTITKSNWKIEYLVKQDFKINKDIYIRVSKGKFESIYKGEHLLEFRKYFIPVYLCETEDEIIMKHGCATDCAAITLISKQDSTLIETFEHVADFNEERNILIHLTDETYDNESEMFQIAVINLKSNKRSKLTLESICTAPYKPSCIDTIIYKVDEVEIVTSLRESIEEEEYSKRRNVVKI